MADLTAKRDVRRQPGEVVPFSAGAEEILEGALVAVNSSGYAVNAGDDAGAFFVGVCDETVDNSAGAAGDEYVKVRVGGVIDVATAFAAAQTNVGDAVTASDNQTVDLAATTTNDVHVGRIVEVISSSKVRVALAPLGRA